MAESLCRAPEKRKQFPEATTAISYEMTLQTYCQRLLKPSFWGGEPELLVLAKIVRRPIVVYIPAAQGEERGDAGAFYLTLVPIRPRRRGERRSLRTFPGASLSPALAFNPRPRRLSTLSDAFELHPDIRSGTQSGYVPIQTYGREFEKGGSGDKTGKGRKPVRLLYNGQNHYDLLIP